MPEHLIRLRGGWLWLDPQAPPAVDGAGRRVTLPWTWPIDPAGRDRGLIRLVRAFGAPPFDPRREALSLRCEHVGGLVALVLNGRTRARPPAGTTALEVPLPDPLPPRSLLVLEVDLEGTRPEPVAAAWGAIALVLRPAAEELLGGSGPGA